MIRPSVFFKGLGGFASKHLPEILSGVSIGLIAVTGIFAGKGALEANKRIAEYEARVESVDISVQEKVRISAPCYVPAIIAGLGAAVCIIFANKISFTQLAAATTATAAAEKALMENRAAIKEMFNKKGLQKVDQYINESHAKEYLSANTQIYETSHGNTLCCEGFLTGKKFRASVEWIRKCVNDFNAWLNSGEDPCMNDFMHLLLPLLDCSDFPEYGYNLRMPIDPIAKRPMLMDIQLDSELTDTGEPFLIFTQRHIPVTRQEYCW